MNGLEHYLERQRTMILGIAGPAGSGKDTVADFFVAKGWVRVSLADPLKRIAKEIFDFSDSQLWGPSEKRNEADARYPRGEVDYPESTRTFVKYLTPRHALQQLGTEYGRACYEDVWIEYALRVAKKILAFDVRYDQKTGIRPLLPNEPFDPVGVVIPDVRFENEAQKIRLAGGKILKVVRPGAGLSGEAGSHVSEAGLPDRLIDLVLQNDGSLDALREAVDALHDVLNLNRKDAR